MATTNFALDKLPFGWFDVILVAWLGFGLIRGRKNGMTTEVLPMLQWVSIVVLCGLGYQMVGELLINTLNLDHTLGFVLGYVTLAMTVFILFMVLKKIFMPRLTGSNAFGGGEYYLGMVSGLIRYVCLMIVGLALLNAPYYSSADIARTRAYNNRWYGGGQQEYSGDFIPSMYEVQDNVFKQSLTGPWIKTNLSPLLITTQPKTQKLGRL